MVLKADQQRVRALIKDTLTLLCKNGLHYRSEFCIEALIGITLDKDDVMLVSINETIQDGLEAVKVQSSEGGTCVPSPAFSDSSDSRHRTKDSPKPHAQSYEHSSHDSGMSSSAQTSPRSPAKSSSSVGSKHDRDSSGERKSPMIPGEPRHKRSRRTSSDSTSQPTSPSFDTAVKLEDGSSFTVTTHELEPTTGGQNMPSSLSADSNEDSSDIVVIKDEVLSDSELEGFPSAMSDPSGGMLGMPEMVHGSDVSLSQGRQESGPLWPGPAQYMDPSTQTHPQSLGDTANMSQGIAPAYPTPSVSDFSRQKTAETFICNICHTQFKKRYTLNFHLKRHAGIYQYYCKLCGRGFSATINLKLHMKKCHSTDLDKTT